MMKGRAKPGFPHFIISLEVMGVNSRISRIKRLSRMLSELVPYSFLSKEKLEEWLFASGSRKTKPDTYDRIVKVGFKWRFEEAPAWFKKELPLRPVLGKRRVMLKLWFGGESLVLVDGKPYGEINEYHRTLDVTPFCDGKNHCVEIQVVPRGLFGKPQEPIFSEAYLIIVDEEIAEIVRTLELVLKTAEALNNEYVSKELLDVAEEFLSSVWTPRETSVYGRAIQEDPAMFGEVTSVWKVPELEEFEGIEMPPEHREKLLEAFETFKTKLKKLREKHEPSGSIHLVGHSHIDYAWLWPVEETKRKILRTFANAVTLSKLYPEFVYTQSSAQMYQDLKESQPWLFEEIKTLVEEGKWEPIGGMWVESDCNIPSLESLIRQFYYGQKFFEREFGKKSKVCWLPDVFGFPWTLPQILKQAGIEFFVTTKLNWNDTNEFPYDLCRWRGIDGTEVLYFSFNNPRGGYNGNVEPDTIYRTWQNFRQKDLCDKVLLTFGYGDGGGGPTADMVENYRILREMPGLPKLEMGSVEKFFETLKVEKELPVWDGELYLECHRGTYTSQSRTKKLHKEAEDALYFAEFLSVFSKEDFSEELDELWKALLRNEFHDILPGSSIREVHEGAENELLQVKKRAWGIAEEVLKSLTSEENVLSVLNLSSFENKLVFQMDKGLKLSFRGKEFLVQRTHDGKYVYLLDEEIAPFSKVELEVTGEVDQSLENREDLRLENEFLVVEVNEDGTFQVYDKEMERYAFKNPANVLKLHKNVPAYWDNWDIADGVEKTGFTLVASSAKKIETGPVREVVEVVYEAEGSKIVQRYVLYRSSRRIDIETEIDWHTRRALLRAYFPVNVLTRKATFDISGGFVERPTHRNTSYEKARFEVPAHRWADLSQADFGVAILNDGRYGYSVHENVIAVSLIKAGVYPDFLADEGLHKFTYSVYVHPGDELRNVVREAEELNKPLIVRLGRLDLPGEILKVTPHVFKVTSFRKDSIGRVVLRMVEVLGTSGKLSVTIPWLNGKVFSSDVLEEKMEEISFPLDFSPFKIFTFVIS